MQRRRWSSLLLVAVAAGACTDGGVQPNLPDLSTILTPEVAAGLKPDGRFALAGAPPGQMTAEQATAVAVALNLHFGRMLAATWEQERDGAAVNVDALKPCGDPLYARSAYQDIPVSANHAIRQMFGPYWLTTLCGTHDDPEVSIAIPAVDTSLRVADGRLLGIAGAQVIAFGIPTEVRSVPPSAEQAAQEVAARTGRRIAAVPELVVAPLPQAPQLSRWRIVLESPVTTRGLQDMKRRDLSRLYYGFGATWNSVGLLAGDTVMIAAFPNPDGKGSTPVQLTPGYANRYQSVTVVP